MDHLWIVRGDRIFFDESFSNPPRAALRIEFRGWLRLIFPRRRVRSGPVARHRARSTHNTIVQTPVHRFRESIGGRDYLIEAAPVADDRWRACLVRVPGVPTALMPFYGATPEEAARQLCDWLSRAHTSSSSGR